MVEMIAVESSNIAAVGYDETTKKLTVNFKNGSSYIYADVEKEKAQAIVGADSVGKYLNAHIKPHHPFEKA